MTKDVYDFTLKEFLAFAKDANSALTQLIGRVKGKPTYAIVAVVGEEETEELLKLLETMKTVE